MEDPLKEPLGNPPQPNICVQKGRLHLPVRKFPSLFLASRLTRTFGIIFAPFCLRRSRFDTWGTGLKRHRYALTFI